MNSQHSIPERTINYIEFNVTDIPRAKAFYGEAFGWTFTDFGSDYCEFNDGHMKGGFDATGPIINGGPLVVLYSANLEDTCASVEKAGGRISKQIFEFPGGRRFHFTDPEGYELGVWSET
jgi:uncharacterized protein